MEHLIQALSNKQDGLLQLASLLILMLIDFQDLRHHTEHWMAEIGILDLSLIFLRASIWYL